MFANTIKELRNAKGLSQADLAKEFNVAQQTVGKWEKGITCPFPDTLQKLADYFHVSTDYLLDRTPPKVATIIQEVLASENKRFILEAIKTMPDEDVAEVGRYVVFRQLLRQQPKLELLLGHDPFNQKTAANGEKGETL